MAACLKNGDVFLLRSYDDVIPTVSLTKLKLFEYSTVQYFNLYARNIKVERKTMNCIPAEHYDNSHWPI